jgi:hypothetical protein
MKKILFLLILFPVFLKAAPFFSSADATFIYYQFKNNDFLKEGFYQSVNLLKDGNQNQIKLFASSQQTESDDTIKQNEIFGSYSHNLGKIVKMGIGMKYVFLKNSVYDDAFLIELHSSLNVKQFSFSLSPAYSKLKIADFYHETYQLTSSLQFYYKDFVLSLNNYPYIRKNSGKDDEEWQLFQEFIVGYYGTNIGIYGAYKSGELFLLNTFESSYLNVSPDDFQQGFSLGILYYPILRNWSINYEFRKNDYQAWNEANYYIQSHLINLYYHF